jgi:hypothetical protein
MSENKFKVWDKDQKIMSKPFGLEWLLANGDCLEFENGISLPLNDLLFFKEDYEFIRSTGCMDSRKKEIFEGDVLYWNDQLRVVIWSTEFYGWLTKDILDYEEDKTTTLFGFSWMQSSGKPFKIVKNIYKYPELVKHAKA